MLRDVADVGAAATAEDREVRQRAAQRDVARREVGGIAVVEILGLVELGVAEHGGVRAQTADPLAPGARLRDRPREVRRVRAIDHVVERRPVGLGVDLLDRGAQRLPARQAAVRLDRERHRDGQSGRARGAHHADRLVGVGERERGDRSTAVSASVRICAEW